MRCLIDSSVLFEAERRRFDLVAWLRDHDAQAALCDATVAEFLVGRPCKDAGKQLVFERFYRDKVARLARLPIVGTHFERAGEMIQQARCRGASVSLGDGLHAAAAEAYQCTVLTTDTEDFAALGVPCQNPLAQERFQK